MAKTKSVSVWRIAKEKWGSAPGTWRLTLGTQVVRRIHRRRYLKRVIRAPVAAPVGQHLGVHAKGLVDRQPRDCLGGQDTERNL